MVSASFLCRPRRFGCQSERFDLPLHSANRNRMNRTATLRKWIPQYKANLALAGPVVLSQIGQVIVQLSDNLMVARLGALPLAAVNSGIRAALGALFTWKAAVLLTVIVCSVLFYRPFCKWLCPLVAFYALLNRVSLFQMQVDTHKCASCGACAKACKMDVDITKNPNHAECIRCGMCMKACPTDAICYRYGLGDKTQTTDKGETI